MMRTLSLLATLAVFVWQPGVGIADEAAMRANVEKAAAILDDAFVKQDAERIATMVTSDHRSVTPYYGKTLTTAEQIETLDEFKARLFDVADKQVILLGDDAALVTFEKSYDGTFAGKPLPARVFVSALWSKKDDRWQQVFYQETAIDADAK